MKACFCLCITLYLGCHPQLFAQALTKQLPPASADAQASKTAAQPAQNASQDAPQYPPGDTPVADVVPPPQKGVPVRIAAREQGKQGDLWTLSGDVEIDYRDYIVRADTITYNEATGEVVATGHLQLEGGPDNERIEASHGTIDLDQETAHLYDVTGMIGVHRYGTTTKPAAPSAFINAPSPTIKLANTSNPFIMTGREVFKDGPQRYRVLGGSMTSCQLPDPDWRLISSRINVIDGKATARSSWFTLLKVPLFFLPYVTHAVNTESRQTGFLVPTFGTSSVKGVVLGEEFYWVINRGADLTFGSEYYSKRGFAPRAEFRYRGRGQDFLTVNFHALLDRGLPSGMPGVPPTNQNGQDLIVSGRHDFTPQTRAVSDIEYLSSYVYRQAFEENFSIATSSEVKSDAFLLHQNRGISSSLYLARYQSFQSDAAGDEIRILHLPSVQAEAVDHSFGRAWNGLQFLWGFQSALDLLTRSEPLFHARNVVRIDLNPHLAVPFSAGGWTFRPVIGGRETFYSRSELLPSPFNGSVSPTLQPGSLNRADFEAGFDIRPPALQRDFSVPWLQKLMGGELRHTIEPDVQYRYVTGINKFNSVLRFDDRDVASDTNEIEYSLTQRLFARHTSTHPCRDDEPQTPDAICGGGTIDWLTWQVAQKYFFNPDFGGAALQGQRNVLSSTLDLSGTAFLSGPRDYSPVISRLRLRTTSATDVEWDIDYDTKTGRINSTNLFAGYRHDAYYFGIGEFKVNLLEGPAASSTATAAVAARPNFNSPRAAATSGENVAAAVTDFNQLRLLFTYGSPARRGFNLGANSGYDFVQGALQFGGIETGYNWNCCGMSAEYRRYALGSVRNENQYLFSFTLAGVGTAGNLKRAVRIF
jgi:LPS-assembly protein